MVELLKVNLVVQIVGVAGAGARPRPVSAPSDATLQDILHSLTESGAVPLPPRGQSWKWKLGNTYQDEGMALEKLGIRDGYVLRLVLEQKFG